MGTLAAGIKEIFATAKTTGSNVMLCGNDGTPDGHMTMANLASVLGALSPLAEVGQNEDWDTLTNTGFHMVALAQTPPNGYPSVGGENAYGYGILYVIHTPAFIQQIYITDQGGGNTPYSTNHGIYIRGGYLSLADCTWTKISNAEYLNQYRNLSDLANALGENFVYSGKKGPGDSSPTIFTFNVTVEYDGFCVLLIQRNFFNVPSSAAIVTIGFGEANITSGGVLCSSNNIVCSIASESGYTTQLTVEGTGGNAFGMIFIKALSHKGNFSIVKTS